MKNCDFASFHTDSSAPDVPSNFIASFIYQLPFGAGKRWMTSISRPAQWVLGGWQVAGITTIHSGTPLVIGVQPNLLNSGFNNRANATCSGRAPIFNVPSSTRFGVEWFSPGCFAEPTQPYVLGDAAPGAAFGPGVTNFDLSLSKSKKIGESKQITIRADAFNAFNNPHFSNPNTTCCAPANPSYDVISGTQLTPRMFQLGVDFSF